MTKAQLHDKLLKIQALKRQAKRIQETIEMLACSSSLLRLSAKQKYYVLQVREIFEKDLRKKNKQIEDIINKEGSK